MNGIHQWSIWPIWLTLIPALLHTLWFGALVAVMLVGGLLAVPASRSRLRYGMSLAALIAVALGGVTAWAVLQHRSVATGEALRDEPIELLSRRCWRTPA